MLSLSASLVPLKVTMFHVLFIQSVQLLFLNMPIRGCYSHMARASVSAPHGSRHSELPSNCTFGMDFRLSYWGFCCCFDPIFELQFADCERLTGGRALPTHLCGTVAFFHAVIIELIPTAALVILLLKVSSQLGDPKAMQVAVFTISTRVTETLDIIRPSILRPSPGFPQKCLQG